MLSHSVRPSDTVLLFDACLIGNQRGIIDLLLEGLSVDTPNQHDQTLLMVASQKGDEAMVELLLSQGADVNARDAFGRNCLHHAVGSGDSQLVRYLVSAGAEIESSTKGPHATSLRLPEHGTSGDSYISRAWSKYSRVDVRK